MYGWNLSCLIPLQINELKASLGPLSGRNLQYCTEACLKRYLEARNWNVDKSKKMLEETLRWRSSYKPEEIRWVRGKKSFPIYNVCNHNFNKLSQSVFVFSMKLQRKVKLGRFFEQIFMIVMVGLFLYWGQGNRYSLVTTEESWNCDQIFNISLFLNSHGFPFFFSEYKFDRKPG